MSERGFVRFAGWAGLATFVLFIVGLTLQVGAGPAPAFTDTAKLTAHVSNHPMLVIGSALVISLALMIELVFVLGIRDLIQGAGGAWTSIGDLFLLFYVVAFPIGLVASGLVIAAATEAASKGDPSATRALWGGAFSLLGAVSFLPLILATLIFAVAVPRTHVLPRWTAWIAWIAAVGGAAAVPAAFGGTGFYSQLGMAPSLLQGVPGLVWVLVVSISMIRRSASDTGIKLRAT